MTIKEYKFYTKEQICAKHSLTDEHFYGYMNAVSQSPYYVFKNVKGNENATSSVVLQDEMLVYVLWFKQVKGGMRYNERLVEHMLWVVKQIKMKDPILRLHVMHTLAFEDKLKVIKELCKCTRKKR